MTDNTIIGDSTADSLVGTLGDDLILGLAGNDTINGAAGDDVIFGDSGNSLSAGGEGVPGTTLGDGPGSTGGGYDRISGQSVYNGNHTFSTDAFYLGNDIPVLDDANRNAITGVSFSQDGEGTDRTFGLDELTFTGAQRSFVGLVTVQNVDVHNANDQFSSSISGGFQDVSVVSSGTADFTMNDGQVFQGIRVNFVRGPDGETYMMPDDGPSPYAFNAFRNMLATNDSGIKSFTIATGSGDDAGINPIEGNWADGQFAEITNPPVGDSFDDVLCGDEGDDIIYGDGGDSATAAGFGVAGGLLDPEERVDGTLYGRFPGSVYNGQFDFSSDAFYLGDDIGVLDGGNRNELRGQTFSQDGGGNTRVTELVDIDFTGAQKSFVGLATVQRTALHRANDQFSASNGDGFQDVVVVNDVDVTFTMNDGTVFQNIRMQFLRGDDGKTYLIADDHPQEGTFNSIRTTVYRNDSGIESFTIQSSSGNINGINPIVGNWAAGQFKVTQDGEGGDDIIKGGAGSDTMFGEGGDDTFLVESAADGAGDVVVGGNGPDQNTDTDVLDLRGAGVVTIDAVADDNDAGAQSGTVTFNNGETLTFEGIEEILQDEPALTIAPAPGTQTDPATGNPLTAENGTAAQIVITRNTPTDEALEVFLTNGDPSETDAPVSVIIPAGAAFVIVDIPSVDDPIVDGDQISTITATANGFDPVSQDVTVADDDVPTLTIAPAPGAPLDPLTGNPLTAENGDPAQIVITRNTPTDQPLEVFLTNGDPTETDAPVSVIIPAGETSVTVDIPSVDDTDVDGPQVSTITATAPDTNPGAIDVTVADDDLPTLTIAPAPGAPTDPLTGNPLTAENGAPVDIIISRDGPTDQPLVVTLSSDDTTEATVPPTVTIPAGASSVTVPITPVDDSDADGPQFPTITATAPGTNPGSLEARVNDDDLELTVEVSPNSQADGNGTVEGGPDVLLLITRNGPVDEDLVVTLTNSDPSETSVPATVTIPAGSSSIEVPVSPIDDTEIDGPQTSTITASAPGFAPADQDVVVLDNERPTITIAPDPSATLDADGRPVLVEGGAPVDIVISRDGPTTDDLVVTLSSDDTTEATVPPTVTIPAGSSSVTVPITPVDDSEVDGPQFPTITATAPGTNPGTIDVVVQDDDLPTLTITSPPGAPTDPLTGNPLTAENGAPAQIVISRDGPVDEDLVVTLTDGDPTETDAPATVTILAGQSSVTVDIPSVDDTDVDGDQISTITATAPGANPGSIDVTVADDDVLPVTLTIDAGPGSQLDADGRPILVENGTPGFITISRDGPTDQPLQVTLGSDDISEAVVPGIVEIPAGASSVNVPVFPVDDPDIDGPKFPTITATADGATPASLEVRVDDDDVPVVPELTIEAGPNTPTDGNGNPVTIENGDPVEIVITRNGPTDEPLTVFLFSGDTTEASVGVPVIIEAGQDSVTALVSPVDDTEIDGPQTATIFALATGFPLAQQDVVVNDDDVPAPKGTVSGRVWCDEDEDGIEDPLEPGIGGVTVQLRDADNGFVTVATVETGPDGQYTFTNVDPGNYCVFFEDSDPNTIWTDKGIGGSATDSNVIEARQNSNGETDIFEVVPGGNVKDIDAGVIKLDANQPPVAGDDREGPVSNFDLIDGDENPVVITASDNALTNDFDPDGDTIEIISFGTDTTVDGDGWFDWQAGTNGGELRLNTDGTFQFRDNAGEFEELGSGDMVETGLTYEISDGNGETDTATITFEIEGQDCGCPPPPFGPFDPMDM